MLLFAIIIGVLPSVFATFYVLLTGLDGGFYMPPDFLLEQRRALASLCLIVCLAAIVALIFLLNSFRGDSSDKGGRIGIACAIACLIAWDLFFFMGLRATLNAPMTQGDIHSIAERATSPVLDYTYDGRTYWVELRVGDTEPTAALSPSRAGPILCRSLGSVFRGPVQNVGLRTTGPNGELAGIEIAREDCREWYLRDRRAINQPASRPRLSADDIYHLYN